jgi:hypothetical protein
MIGVRDSLPYNPGARDVIDHESELRATIHFRTRGSRDERWYVLQVTQGAAGVRLGGMHPPCSSCCANVSISRQHNSFASAFAFTIAESTRTILTLARSTLPP